MKLKSTFLIFSLLVFINFIKSQTNVISTAVPFLTISPDARSSSLGYSGAATSPDIFSQSQNPAKYAFFKPEKNLLSDWNYRFLYQMDTCTQDSSFRSFKENIRNSENKTIFDCIDSTATSNNFSFALSYTPLLRNLISDVDLASFIAFKRLDNFQSIAGSLRFLSWGDVTFMSEYGDATGQQSPKEFALDLSYIRLLSKYFSSSVTFRYIRSDLTGGQLVNGTETHAGKSFAADFSFFYFKKIQKNMKDRVFSTGLYVSNIGSKISYSEGEMTDFLPTNIKLGMAYSIEVDMQNSFTISMDANKLLVPTPSIGNSSDEGVFIPIGYSSDKSVVTGMFSSFSDAPGGLTEELNEISLSGGIEYAYQQSYFLRAGYFHENESKGNRKFFSAGIGSNLVIQKKILTIDAAYLIPMARYNSLGSTMQLSISFTI